jgi:hypothetical protein
MTNYRSTEQTVLIGLLSKYTADYTKLLTENGSRQQLDKLNKEIIAIQKEINYRSKLDQYTDGSTDYIYLKDPDIL